MGQPNSPSFGEITEIILPSSIITGMKPVPAATCKPHHILSHTRPIIINTRSPLYLISEIPIENPFSSPFCPCTFSFPPLLSLLSVLSLVSLSSLSLFSNSPILPFPHSSLFLSFSHHSHLVSSRRDFFFFHNSMLT
jgi:hypothetical protein